jgi:hypothetical protein
MKALVLYRSKSGFTKKYAEWIARELSAEVLEAKGAGRPFLPIRHRHLRRGAVRGRYQRRKAYHRQSG